MYKKRIVIDVSDAKVSTDSGEVLATYSLGSCIGLCLYEPNARIGGLLHFQLPDSKHDPKRADERPFMYADTGTVLLMNELLRLGANKRLIHVKIAGGASMPTGPKGFDIGKQNYLAIRKIFWQMGMMIEAEDVGGSWPRNVYMDIDTGNVTVRGNELEKVF
jgi:chemotaxis protein CheD